MWLGLASAAPAADFHQDTGRHRSRHPNHINSLADLPILQNSGNSYGAPAAPVVASDSYGAPAAPVVASDSYGAPAAPVVASDSYGAPAAPVVASDSYGSPAAAPIDSEGTPAAPPIDSDGCQDVPRKAPQGYKCKEIRHQVPKEVASETSSHSPECETVEVEPGVYGEKCETKYDTVYETIYEWVAVPIAPLPLADLPLDAANDPFRFDFSSNYLEPDPDKEKYGSHPETARASGQRLASAIPPSAQYLTPPQAGRPPRRQLRPRIDKKPKGILEEMNSTLQKLGRQAHSWNVSMFNKISNLFL